MTHLAYPTLPSRIRSALLQTFPGFTDFVHRLGVAARFVMGRSTHEDGFVLMDAGENASKCYPLVVLEVDSIVDDILSVYEDHPDLRPFAERAARRVQQKWTGNAEVLHVALEWALDLVSEYADEAGVPLVKKSDGDQTDL